MGGVVSSTPRLGMAARLPETARRPPYPAVVPSSLEPDETPESFRHAVSSLREAEHNSAVTLREVPSPGRLAPYSFALSAEVLSGDNDDDLAAGRFVVQIGAFADANGARETRAKVEKLGLRTYTQAVVTDNGKRTRVRLGPFASRDEAEQAAAKVKAAGLPAAVLTL